MVYEENYRFDSSCAAKMWEENPQAGNHLTSEGVYLD